MSKHKPEIYRNMDRSSVFSYLNLCRRGSCGRSNANFCWRTITSSEVSFCFLKCFWRYDACHTIRALTQQSRDRRKCPLFNKSYELKACNIHYTDWLNIKSFYFAIETRQPCPWLSFLYNTILQSYWIWRLMAFEARLLSCGGCTMHMDIWQHT